MTDEAIDVDGVLEGQRVVVSESDGVGLFDKVGEGEHLGELYDNQ